MLAKLPFITYNYNLLFKKSLHFAKQCIAAEKFATLS